MHIRQAEMEDMERLRAMKSEVASAVFLKTCTTSEVQAWLNANNSAAWWTSMLRDPSHTYIVENGAGSLIGAATISYLDYTTAYFGSLYCRLKNSGVGSMLMRQRLITATEMAVERCTCNVLASNTKAQRFVEHYGFHVAELYVHPILRKPMMRYVREPHLDALRSDNS